MKTLLIAIPVYGEHHLTENLLRDLVPQISSGVEVLVVDNRGDYAPFGTEQVVVPGSNTGWAGGSNLAFRIGFSSGFSHVMTLNNDTRVSQGFVAGILDDRLPGDAGVIAPLYDSVVPTQRSSYTEPADGFRSRARYRKVSAVDGTSMAVSKDAWRVAGDLDVTGFGRFGWGSEVQLCFRIRDAGFPIVVSELSYLNHIEAQTARAVAGRTYLLRAVSRQAIGIRRTMGQKEWTRRVHEQPTEVFDLNSGALVESVPAGSVPAT